MKGSMKKRVLVAMSGGVDSSVSAALLQRQGYECVGVYMRLGTAAEVTGLQAPDAAAFPASAADAAKIAEQLGIKLTVLDCRDDLRQIIEYFVAEYRQGRTPNPCVRCNRLLKFGKLLQYAQSLGADFLATGHYARMTSTPAGPRLRRGSFLPKDQSYVLYGMGAANQAKVLLPLGDYAKEQVRALAVELGLFVHDKGESQEICFIPDDDYVRLLSELAPDMVRRGEVRHVDGRLLGEHDGIFRYTIGQRRGLGIALGDPAYVVRLDAATNTVWLGAKENLTAKQLQAVEMIWLTPQAPTEPFAATVQIRYNNRGAGALVYPLLNSQGLADKIQVVFETPVTAVTPGQSAVIYDADHFVLGGGVIA